MGYRSTVKIIAGKNAAAELIEVNKKHEYFTVTPGLNDETLFEADWIKWIDDADDIAEYVEVIDKYLDLGSDDRADGIDFYRLGEDSEDVDHQSTYSTYASLDMEIVVSNFEKQPEPKG